MAASFLFYKNKCWIFFIYINGYLQQIVVLITSFWGTNVVTYLPHELHFSKQECYKFNVEMWLFSLGGIYIILVDFCTERVDHFEKEIFIIFNTNTDIYWFHG